MLINYATLYDIQASQLVKIWASTQNDKSYFLRKYINALKTWECDDVNELIVNLEDGLPNSPPEGRIDLEQVYTIVQYIDKFLFAWKSFSIINFSIFSYIDPVQSRWF